ncbi:hypothetical protein Tco_1212782 [Tanacetum coccineum]
MTLRSCLRWKPTGKIFRTVGLRWVPTGKIFTPSTTKVDSEPPNGSNADITNQYESVQTLDVSAGLNPQCQMAPDHVSSDPGPQCSTKVLDQDSLSPGPQSQENVPQVAETVIRSGYQQKDRKPSQNDKTEHGMEKTVQNQGQSPKKSMSKSIQKNQQSNRSRN